jgi:hypothetical protein
MPIYDIIRQPRSPRTIGPVEVRIWYKIEVGEPDECWLWTASVDRGGYGQINAGLGEIRKAHRIVLEIKIGRRLVGGEWALHTCDVPACCNPAHLYVGTVKDNVRDMHERGRYRGQTARGAENGNAKLTDAEVLEIKAALAGDARRGLRAALATKYGVDRSIITRIADGRMWKHVR